MSRTEEVLALEARKLASTFNFETRKPKHGQDLKYAQILYREIFYEQAFYKVKSKNFQFIFDAKVYGKTTSCTRCAKKVHEQLRDFSDRVLN